MPKETKTKKETIRKKKTAPQKDARTSSLRPPAAKGSSSETAFASADLGKGKSKGASRSGKTGAASGAKNKKAAAGKKAAARPGEDALNGARKETEAAKEEAFVRWTGKNFIRREWEKPFYRVCLIASAIVILMSLGDGSWLRAVTFSALAAILIFELRDEPKDISYEVNIDGIEIDGKLYRFEDIRSFELGKKGGFDIVRLQLKGPLFPIREIHLAEGQDILYMETLLEYFLPKEAQEDALFSFHKEEKEKELTDEEFINKKVDEYLKGRS